MHEEYTYTIVALCDFAKVTRAGYYKWLNRKPSTREAENQRILKVIEEIYTESPDKGYRRICDDLAGIYKIHINDKRALRLCRFLHIQSTIKHRYNSCTRRASHPEQVAENILNRCFDADKPNEKWVTDVTEFKYYDNGVKKKIYLSAILDLYDKRIVSHVISDRNDNALVFKTFDIAIAREPNAHPLFHSDRGFQYTSRKFNKKLVNAGMTQSMSRVGKCIDNGPMEGYWGIHKRERYYGRKFTSKNELITIIQTYIHYYNNKRLQRGLGILTPIEKHQQHQRAA